MNVNPKLPSATDSANSHIMKHVSIDEAQACLSELIQKTLAGEEIIIAQEGQPRVKLVALPQRPQHPPKRRIGGAKDVILWISDDFDAPLEEFDSD